MIEYNLNNCIKGRHSTQVGKPRQQAGTDSQQYQNLSSPFLVALPNKTAQCFFLRDFHNLPLLGIYLIFLSEIGKVK